MSTTKRHSQKRSANWYDSGTPRSRATEASTATAGCCGPQPAEIAERIGYSAQDTAAVPEGANLGLGCGAPLAAAALQEGETVLDLGSGAGFDAFLAAREVGPTGRVIGVDMTDEMLAKARANAQRAASATSSFARVTSRRCRWKTPVSTWCSPTA